MASRFIYAARQACTRNYDVFQLAIYKREVSITEEAVQSLEAENLEHMGLLFDQRLDDLQISRWPVSPYLSRSGLRLREKTTEYNTKCRRGQSVNPVQVAVAGLRACCTHGPPLCVCFFPETSSSLRQLDWELMTQQTQV